MPLVSSFAIAVIAFAADGLNADPVADASIPATPNFSAMAGAAFAFVPVESVIDAPSLDETSDAQEHSPTSAPAATSDSASHTLADATHHNAFFKRGSWRWQISLAGATDFNDNSNALAGFGVSYFMDDEFTIDFELNGLYFNQDDGDNTAGVNLALLFRWHFWRSNDQRWSIYVDAGAGVLFAGDDVPPEGSSFAFTPQAGMGFSALVSEEKDARLLAGLRWYHISNANLFESNPGSNRLEIYAGLNFPF